ncbi:MAG: hypothetical protein LBE65_03435 [Synergistaceae bacterium]|nr:hypothetical protein [Synergistaceae bacterium]
MPNNNINIRFEKGVFQISAEIPVAGAREAIESFMWELNSQILGEERSADGQSSNITPKMLNERDAAKYIGKSVSFLRTCRYKAKRGEMDTGPRYIRVRNKFILYPIKELDDWSSRRLFSTCLEEKIYAASCEIMNFPVSQSKDEVVSNA